MSSRPPTCIAGGRGVRSGCWDTGGVNATSTTPTRQSEATPFALPARSLEGVGKRPFGIYIHVPFCATRCGYCDFNTSTTGDLGTSAYPKSESQGPRSDTELSP